MLQNLGRKRILVILTLLALCLLGASIPQMKLSIGFYGLIHSFPIMYFAGLGLLGTTFVVTLLYNPSRMLLGLQTLGLVVTLWLLPTVVGSHPGITMAYRSLYLIDSVAAQGVDVRYNFYLAWPGFHVLFSPIASWGVNLEGLIPVFPFIIQLAYFPPLFVFLRNLVGKDREDCCWIGVWLFYLGNWVGVDGFFPQPLAFLLLLTVLALVTHREFWEGSTRIRCTMTTILLGTLGALAVTHLLTSVTVACLLGAYAIVRKSLRLVAISLTCVLLILVWDVSFGGHYTLGLAGENYGRRLFQSTPAGQAISTWVTAAIPSTASSLPPKALPDRADAAEKTREAELTSGVTYDLMDRTGGYRDDPSILIFDPEYIVATNIASSLSGSDSHVAVVRIRIANSALFVTLSFLGAVFIVLRRRSRETLAVLAMALSLFLLLPMRYAGWELTTRLYMFGLPFAAYLGATLLSMIPKDKRHYAAIGLCLLIPISSILFLVSHYGNQVSDYWSENHSAGYWYSQKWAATTDYWLGQIRYINYEDGEVTFNEQGFTPTHYYFILSEQDDRIFTHIYDRPDFVDNVWEWARESPSHVSVYRNPEYEIFKWIKAGG